MDISKVLEDAFLLVANTISLGALFTNFGQQLPGSTSNDLHSLLFLHKSFDCLTAAENP